MQLKQDDFRIENMNISSILLYEYDTNDKVIHWGSETANTMRCVLICN